MSDTTNPTNLNIITPVPKPEGLVELLVSPRVDTYVFCNSTNQSLAIQQHQEHHHVQPPSHQELHPLPELDNRSMLLPWDDWDEDEVVSSVIGFLVLMSLILLLAMACYVSHTSAAVSSSS